MRRSCIRRVGFFGAALLAALLAAGCAVENGEPLWPEPSALGRGLPARRAVDAASRVAVHDRPVEEPVRALALRTALALALTRHPALAAASWAVRAAEARALQEGLSPNPEVRVTMDEFGGTGDFEGTRYSEQVVRLSQVIELGEKAAKRRRTAHLEAALCGWDYETARLDVLTETTKAFIAVLAAQQRAAAAEEMRRHAESVLALVTKRVRGGAGSEIEVEEARIELGTSRVECEQAKQALEAARGILAGCWDAGSPNFRQTTGDLGALPAPGVPTWEQVAASIEGNPDVRRWETEVLMCKAELDRQKADSIPDLRVLVGSRRLEETGDYGHMAALEVSIPIFDRNQGGIREARANSAKAGYDRRAFVLVTLTALRQAHQGLMASHREAALIRDEILPAAERAVATSRQGLEGGAVTDLQLLKAYRALFKVRSRQIDALETCHLSLADVERLTGRPVTDLVRTKPTGDRASTPVARETSGGR